MLKILVVDDDPQRFSFFDSTQVEKFARPEDIRIVTNQKDALSCLEHDRWDVLIVDMALPPTAWSRDIQPTGGVSLLRHIQEDEQLQRPSFIIGLTASIDEDNEVSAFFADSPWVLMRVGQSGSDWSRRVMQALAHAAEVKSAEADVVYETDVCIVTALVDPEQSAVLRTNIEWDADPIYLDSTTLIRRGRLMLPDKTSLSVALASALRMGSVEAALLSAKLIARLRPRLLAMCGICAGVEGKVEFGDPILATTVWDWTSSKWEVNDEGKEIVLPAPHYLECPREIQSRFQQLAQDRGLFGRISDKWPGTKVKSSLSAHMGPVASGPVVVADGTTLKHIKETQNRQVLGLEMEAYGVYSAAQSSGVPRPLVFSIKSVCDYADPRKNDEMQKYAAYTSATFLHEFLFRFGRDLCKIVDP